MIRHSSDAETAYLLAMLLKGKLTHGQHSDLDRDLRALHARGLVRWDRDNWTPTAKGERLMNHHYLST